MIVIEHRLHSQRVALDRFGFGVYTGTCGFAFLHSSGNRDFGQHSYNYPLAGPGNFLHAFCPTFPSLLAPISLRLARQMEFATPRLRELEVDLELEIY